MFINLLLNFGYVLKYVFDILLTSASFVFSPQYFAFNIYQSLGYFGTC
jgi:hypothetical protein